MWRGGRQRSGGKRAASGREEVGAGHASAERVSIAGFRRSRSSAVIFFSILEPSSIKPYGLAFRLVLWFIGRAGHVDHKITGEGAYRSLIVQAKCYLWSSAERDPAVEV